MVRMHVTRTWGLLVVAAAAWGVPGVTGGDVYVSPNGSDANPGTAAAPVKTLTKAAGLVKSGDTVHVGAGVYAEEATLELSTPSVHSHTTWIAAEGGATVRGGVVVGGWAPAPSPAAAPAVAVVSTDVSALDLNHSTRHLFVNNLRCPRARLPPLVTGALFLGASIDGTGYRLAGAGPTPPAAIPCAANHGSSTACCGQKGTVTPQYQCPSSLPTCVDYVYDHHFGHCVASTSTHRPVAAAPESATARLMAGADPSEVLRPGTEMVFPQSTSPWTEPRCAVVEANSSWVTMAQPCWANLLHKACGQNVKTSPTAGHGYVEGAGPDYIAAAGEWALSDDSKTLFYALRPGETAATIEAVLPRLEVLLDVNGVQDVAFSGFTFEAATWLRPGLGDGYVEQQTGCCTIGSFPDNNNCAIEARWSVKSPGNVRVSDATAVSFTKCEFTRLGGVALDLTNTTQCVVDSCYFHDVSGAAVQVGSFTDPLGSASDADNVVRNSIVNKAGAEYSGAAGINVGFTQRTVVTGNDVSNMSYVPISVGWGWSRNECAACTNAGWNIISFNRAHDYKQTLNDGGGIYMLGPQNESDIHHNWVFNQHTASSGALYPDEGSAYSTWHDNVVTDIGSSEWLHLWTGSIHNVTVANNFMDTSTYLNHGTNCPMINNTVFPKGKPPPAAVVIMNASGTNGSNPWWPTLRPLGLDFLGAS